MFSIYIFFAFFFVLTFIFIFILSADEIEEFNLLKKRMKILIDYVLLFRSNDLIVNNHEKNNLSTRDGNHSHNMNNNDYNNNNNNNNSNKNENNYDFNNDNNNDDNNNINNNIYDNKNNDNDNNANDENYEHENYKDISEISFIKIYCWNGNQEFIVSLLPDLPLFSSNYAKENKENTENTVDDFELNIINENENENESENIFNFSIDEEIILNEIFLDKENASILLGDDISNYLNNKLNHEAIDYIQEMTYKNIVCINFIVSGDSSPQILELVPPMISIPGQMSIGRTYKGTSCTSDK